jgi:hypothetical protein
MVRRWGFSDAVGPVSMPEEESDRQSTQTRALIESEVRGLIEAAQGRTMAVSVGFDGRRRPGSHDSQMLTARRAELERLANALVVRSLLPSQVVCWKSHCAQAHETLNGQEVTRILAGEDLEKPL